MRWLVVVIAAVLAAAILVPAGGIGASLMLENQDAFCSACHTEPEATYYQQSTQSRAVTLAAFHTQNQTACIDCHSGGGTLGRAEGLQQGAHDLAQYLSGTYHRPAITTNPLGDDSCAICHADVFAHAPRGGSRSMNGHYHYYLPQWQAVDTQAAHCTSCHPAHTQGLESLQFMAQGQVAQLCDECHTALSGRIR